MNIAVDLDEVVADLLSNLILFHNNTYGTDLKRSDFFSYQYEKVWGGNKEEAIQKVREFIKSEYFLNILPIEDAYEVLSFLKKEDHQLFIVTGRENHTKEITKNWIQKHFPDIFSGIHHTNAYSRENQRIKKSTVCKKLKISVIIDDDVMHIKDCLKAGISVIVFDSPWNQRRLPDGVVRVSRWHQIVKIIDAIN